jgi:hypothetical protein
MTEARKSLLALVGVIQMFGRVQNSRMIAIVVMLLSALGSAIIALHVGGQAQYLDESQWTELSANLANSHIFSLDGIHSTVLRPPGFVCFLVVPQSFHPPFVALRIFNIVALMFCQSLTYRIAKSIGSAFVASIACVMSLAYPVFFYTAALLFPQTLGAALLLWAVWIMTDVRQFSKLRTLGAGTACACLTLTVPALCPLLLLLCLRVLWKRPDFRRQLLFFIAPPVILIGGWSVRNYQVDHSPVFVATYGGMNLLLAYSENSTVSSGSYTNIDKYISVGYPLPEGEADRFYRRSAVKWIESHRSEATSLFLRRFLQYFSFTDGAAANKAPTSLLVKTIMFITYEPLLLLLLLRLGLSSKIPLSEAEICLVGLYLSNAIFSSLFFPRIRFRVPVDWLLIIVGAQTLGIAALQAAPDIFRKMGSWMEADRVVME